MNGRILGGRYELIENIGEGGMAVVYKAKDNKLNRAVAVKILKKEFANNKDIAEKFRREATAIAKLSHPNIVNVLDVGHEEESNMDYFVMEYVNGKTLKEVIVYNGKLSYGTAIDIIIQVAKALECAHKNNIIHRDVKPQNILVTENGDVKVTDFGIAKSSTASTITNTTTIMGSAHYLSPEQAKGTFIDLRTDMYSMGIVLYEMVVGKLPFEGESPVTIALKHIQEKPMDPKDINSSIPESLNRAIIKAIDKEPINRYQNSREFIVDLQKIKENPDTNINTMNKIDDSRTIIMSPIKIAEDEIKEKPKVKTSKDFYTGSNDEEYEEESDKEMNNKPKEKKKKRKSSKGLIVIGVIIVVLLAVGGGIFALSTLNKPKEVTVPNIIGENIEDARKLLEAKGLSLEVVATKNSDEKENTVLESNPKADEVVKKSSIIKVTVSGGVEKVKVPDLRDYEMSYIKQILEQLGLTYNILEEYNDNIEAGYFVSQDPERNTEVEKGSEVTVIISKGPKIKTINIENYRGLTVQDAEKKLQKAKMPYEIVEKETDRENENKVILNQSKDGIQIDDGTKLILEVGKYVEPTIDVSVYINEGMLLGDAMNTLGNQGIDYVINGNKPSKNELNLYVITGFTKEIKKGEKVKLDIEKVSNDTEPNGENNDSEDTTNDESQDDEQTQNTNNNQNTAQVSNDSQAQ